MLGTFTISNATKVNIVFINKVNQAEGGGQYFCEARYTDVRKIAILM